MITLYAITDASGPPLEGLDTPLHAVASGDLAAICAPVTDTPVTPEVLWRHEQVVESLMAHREVLPVRFGTRVADEAAVSQILDDDHDRLARGLEYVRGAVEVSVRAFATSAATERGSGGGEDAGGHEAMTGSDYLRARARELAGEQDAMRSVHEPLRAVARAATLRQTSGPGEVLRAAYLLDRGELSRFRALVTDVESARPDLRLVCTGPWPPYSFSER